MTVLTTHPTLRGHQLSSYGPASMDLSLNEEQKLIQQMAHDFAVKEVEPRARSGTAILP